MAKLLPLGTIVINDLGKNEKVLIIGRLVKKEVYSEVFDYCGCTTPLGVQANEELIFFNHSIEESKKFYIDILGFKLEYERLDNKFAFLSLGDIQIMIEEVNGNWNTGELDYPFGRGINFQMEVSNI